MPQDVFSVLGCFLSKIDRICPKPIGALPCSVYVDLCRFALSSNFALSVSSASRTLLNLSQISGALVRHSTRFASGVHARPPLRSLRSLPKFKPARLSRNIFTDTVSEILDSHILKRQLNELSQSDFLQPSKLLVKFKRNQRGGCSALTPPFACGERYGVHEQPPLRSLRSLPSTQKNSAAKATLFSVIYS